MAGMDMSEQRCYRCGVAITERTRYLRLLDKIDPYDRGDRKHKVPIEVYVCRDCDRQYGRVFRMVMCIFGGLIAALLAWAVARHFFS